MSISCRVSRGILSAVGAFLSVALLVACSSTQQPAKSAKNAAESGNGDAVVGLVTLRGKVLGHDGKPLPLAHVHLGERSVQVEADGTFATQVDGRRLHAVYVTGVDSYDYKTFLWLDGLEKKQEEVSITLGTYKHADTYDNIELINLAKGFNVRHPFKKTPDGRFEIEVMPKPGEYRYQLIGITEGGGRSVNGMQQDRFVYDGGGNYESVIDADGSPIKIVFDPKSLWPSDLKTVMTFADPGDTQLFIAKVSQEANDYYSASMTQDNKKVAELEALWKERLAASQDKHTQHALLVLLCSSADVSDELLKRANSELSADNPMWELSTDAVVRVAKTKGDNFYTFIEAVVSNHHSQESRADLVFAMLQEALMQNQDQLAHKYYNRLQGEFAKTGIARFAGRYNPNRNIRAGRQLPAFEVSSIDEKATFNNERYKGKVLLVKFWASWCKPCVAEMPKLHKLYEKFHGKGFEVLAFATDDKREAVDKFRKGQFPMPWDNAFLEGELSKKMQDDFEVVGLPTGILIDGEGKIIAVNEELRGEQLEPMLKALLAPAK